MIDISRATALADGQQRPELEGLSEGVEALSERTGEARCSDLTVSIAHPTICQSLTAPRFAVWRRWIASTLRRAPDDVACMLFAHFPPAGVSAVSAMPERPHEEEGLCDDGSVSRSRTSTSFERLRCRLPAGRKGRGMGLTEVFCVVCGNNACGPVNDSRHYSAAHERRPRWFPVRRPAGPSLR